MKMQAMTKLMSPLNARRGVDVIIVSKMKIKLNRFSEKVRLQVP